MISRKLFALLHVSTLEDRFQGVLETDTSIFFTTSAPLRVSRQALRPFTTTMALLSFPYRLVVGAILFANIFHQASALNIKYCSDLNTAQTGASKQRSKPPRKVNTDQLASQTPASTSPMDSATISALTITHSRSYKTKHAGVQTMLQLARRQRVIVAFNALDIQTICAAILWKTYTDTWL